MRFGIFKDLFQKIDTLITGRGKIDDELFDEFEEALLGADVNVNLTDELLTELKQMVKDERMKDAADVRNGLEKILAEKLSGCDVRPLNEVSSTPALYIFVGVNGVGKTTTIAKLAQRFINEGKKVMLAAADTFRAAAIEQLQIWADRTGASIVVTQPGGDPSSVIFDAVMSARAKGYDVVLADTAGRLHNRSNLMSELTKIMKVAEKALGRNPDEVLLVIDATTGQNAIRQAAEFAKSVPLTGIVLTKLDGTARGGAVLSVTKELNLPIKLIGVGETAGDLKNFDNMNFVRELLGSDN